MHKIMTIIPCCLILLVMLLGPSVAAYCENDRKLPEKKYESEAVVAFDQHDTSRSGLFLGFKVWKGRPDQPPLQELYILNLLSGVITLVFAQENYYVERNGLSWQIDQILYGAHAPLRNTGSFLWSYDIEKLKLHHIQTQITNQRIQFPVVSPGGRSLLFIGYRDWKDGVATLYFHDLQKFSTTILESEIDVFRPIWLAEKAVIYRKQGNLFMKRLQDNAKTEQLTFFGHDGLVILAKVSPNSRKLFLIRQTPPFDALAREIEEWLRYDKGKTAIVRKPVYTKEYWEIDLLTNKQRLIRAFHTMKEGVFLADSSIVVSLPDDQENYHLWWYKSDGTTQQLTFGQVVDDSPLLVGDNRLIFRRDHKQIWTLSLERNPPKSRM